MNLKSIIEIEEVFKSVFKKSKWDDLEKYGFAFFFFFFPLFTLRVRVFFIVCKGSLRKKEILFCSCDRNAYEV